MNEYKELKPRIIKAYRKDLSIFSLTELREYAKNLNVPIGKNREDVILHLMISGKATICATLGD